MGDKNLLISSMQKLINHVKKSTTNQQQIFYSLSRNDFKKILTNLQQKDAMLRKISLNLIIQLLSNNNQLKKKFCKTMQINLIPGKVIIQFIIQIISQILLNSKTIQKHIKNINLAALMILLKKIPNQQQYDCLLWYINMNNKNMQISYIYNHKIQLDPQQCLIGFCLSSKDIMTQVSTANLSTTTTILTNTTQKQKQKKIQLKNLIQPNPKNIISIVNQKNQSTSSSISQNQPRYQRMHKSIQMQTDRPKKVISTYQPFVRKNNNNYKGIQTDRYMMNSSMNYNNNNDHIIKRQSFQIQKSRPSMPVKIINNQTQHNYYVNSNNNQFNNHNQSFNQNNNPAIGSAYVPVLNFQQNNNFLHGSKTDRISESFTINNRPKQFDFQKVKYQGIKLTSSHTSNNMTQRQKQINKNIINQSMSSSINQNNFNNINNVNNVNKTIDNNFKYIKPMTSSYQQGTKYMSFFPKKNQEIKQKTIDLFQYIKNR